MRSSQRHPILSKISRNWRPLIPSAYIFFLIFLPAILITNSFDVFELFISWVRKYNYLYLDELVSMLLLCLLPFLSYFSYRLFQLNQTLRDNESTILNLNRQNDLILNAAGDGIFGLDKEGHTTFINPSAARMIGCSRKQLLNKHYQTIIKPVTTKTNQTKNNPSAIDSTYQDGKPHRVDSDYFQHNDGHLFPVEYSSTPIREGGKISGVVVTFRDISQRKETESELEHLVAAVRQTADMILITDHTGAVQYVNPAFESISGYTQSEVTGRSVAHLKGRRKNTEIYHTMSQTLTHGKTWKNRFITERKDGTTLHVDASISPIRDQDQTITNYVGVIRNVTQEIELGRQLRQSQRLEAVGTLAGGIAHDFNNILTAILSYTDLAMDDIPEESMTHQNLNEVVIAANRARDLIAHLLIFSRRGERERTPILLKSVVEEVINLLRAVLPATIEIRVSFGKGEYPVLADPTQIHQVIMNLCTNAAQSMWEKGGLLELNLEKNQIDDQQEGDNMVSHIKPGSYMVLRVRDNGQGIEPEELDRIFEPFFTTKDVGKGSGLGLSVVHGIVQDHKGVTTVTSEKGVGSTFQVFLPGIRSAVENTGQKK